jgi:hypothetical protein
MRARGRGGGTGSRPQGLPCLVVPEGQVVERAEGRHAPRRQQRLLVEDEGVLQALEGRLLVCERQGVCGGHGGGHFGARAPSRKRLQPAAC